MEKIKNKLIIFLSLLFVLFPTVVLAGTAGTPIIKVLLNNSQLNFDVPPDLKDGVTLVPARGVFEALGAKVTWDDETKCVFVSAADKAITLQIGKKYATVNGKNVSLLRSPEIIKNRTMVPLRFISEALGAKVGWDEAKRVITIDASVPTNPDGLPIDSIDLSK